MCEPVKNTGFESLVEEIDPSTDKKTVRLPIEQEAFECDCYDCVCQCDYNDAPVK
jgi:hypothetical protein